MNNESLAQQVQRLKKRQRAAARLPDDYFKTLRQNRELALQKNTEMRDPLEPNASAEKNESGILAKPENIITIEQIDTFMRQPDQNEDYPMENQQQVPETTQFVSMPEEKTEDPFPRTRYQPGDIEIFDRMEQVQYPDPIEGFEVQSEQEINPFQSSMLCLSVIERPELQSSMFTEYTEQSGVDSVVLSQVYALSMSSIEKTQQEGAKILQAESKKVFQKLDELEKEFFDEHMLQSGETVLTVILPNDVIEQVAEAVYSIAHLTKLDALKKRVYSSFDKLEEVQQKAETFINIIDDEVMKTEKELKEQEVKHEPSRIRVLNQQRNNLLNTKSQMQKSLEVPISMPFEKNLHVPAFFRGMTSKQMSLNVRRKETHLLENPSAQLLHDLSFHVETFIQLLDRMFVRIQEEPLKQRQLTVIEDYLITVEWIDRVCPDKTTEWYQWFYNQMHINIMLLQEFTQYTAAFKSTLSRRSILGFVNRIHYKVQARQVVQEEAWNSEVPVQNIEEHTNFHLEFLLQLEIFFEQQNQNFRDITVEAFAPESVAVQRSVSALHLNQNTSVLEPIQQVLDSTLQKIRQRAVNLHKQELSGAANYQFRCRDAGFHAASLVKDLPILQSLVSTIKLHPELILQSFKEIVENCTYSTLMMLLGLNNPAQSFFQQLVMNDPLIFSLLDEEIQNSQNVTTAFMNSIALLHEWGLVFLHGMTHRFDSTKPEGLSAARLQRLQMESVEVCMRMSIDYSEFGDVLISDLQPLSERFAEAHVLLKVPYTDETTGFVMQDIIRKTLHDSNQMCDAVRQGIFSGLLRFLKVIDEDEEVEYFYGLQSNQDMIQVVSRGGLDKSLENNRFVMENLKVKALPTVADDMRVQACLAGGYCMAGYFFLLSLSPQMLQRENLKVQGRKEELAKTKPFSSSTIMRQLIENPNLNMHQQVNQLMLLAAKNQNYQWSQDVLKFAERASDHKRGVILFQLAALNHIGANLMHTRLVSQILLAGQAKRNLEVSQQIIEEEKIRIQQIDKVIGGYMRSTKEVIQSYKGTQLIPPNVQDPSTSEVKASVRKVQENLKDNEELGFALPAYNFPHNDIQADGALQALKQRGYEVETSLAQVDFIIQMISSAIHEVMFMDNDENYSALIVERSVEVIDKIRERLARDQDRTEFLKIIQNISSKNEKLTTESMKAISRISTSFGDNGSTLAKVLNKVQEQQEQLVQTLSQNLSGNQVSDISDSVKSFMEEASVGLFNLSDVQLLQKQDLPLFEAAGQLSTRAQRTLRNAQERDLNRRIAWAYSQRVVKIQTFVIESMPQLRMGEFAAKYRDDGSKPVNFLLSVLMQTDDPEETREKMIRGNQFMIASQAKNIATRLRNTRTFSQQSLDLLSVVGTIGLSLSLISWLTFTFESEIVDQIEYYGNRMIALQVSDFLYKINFMHGLARNDKTIHRRISDQIQIDERVQRMQQAFIKFLQDEQSEQYKITDNFLLLGLNDILVREQFEDYEPEQMRIQALVRGSLLSHPSHKYIYAIDQLQKRQDFEVNMVNNLSQKNRPYQNMRELQAASVRYVQSGARFNNLNMLESYKLLLTIEESFIKQVLTLDLRDKYPREIQILEEVILSETSERLQTLKFQSIFKFSKQMTKDEQVPDSQIQLLKDYQVFFEEENKFNTRVNSLYYHNAQKLRSLSFVQYTLGLNEPLNIGKRLANLHSGENEIVRGFFLEDASIQSIGIGRIFEVLGPTSFLGEVMDLTVPFMNTKINPEIIANGRQYIEAYTQFQSGQRDKDLAVRAIESNLFSILVKATSVKKQSIEQLGRHAFIERFQDSFQQNLALAMVETVPRAGEYADLFRYFNKQDPFNQAMIKRSIKTFGDEDDIWHSLKNLADFVLDGYNNLGLITRAAYNFNSPWQQRINEYVHDEQMNFYSSERQSASQGSFPTVMVDEEIYPGEYNFLSNQLQTQSRNQELYNMFVDVLQIDHFQIQNKTPDTSESTNYAVVILAGLGVFFAAHATFKRLKNQIRIRRVIDSLENDTENTVQRLVQEIGVGDKFLMNDQVELLKLAQEAAEENEANIGDRMLGLNIAQTLLLTGFNFFSRLVVDQAKKVFGLVVNDNVERVNRAIQDQQLQIQYFVNGAQRNENPILPGVVDIPLQQALQLKKIYEEFNPAVMQYSQPGFSTVNFLLAQSQLRRQQKMIYAGIQQQRVNKQFNVSGLDWIKSSLLGSEDKLHQLEQHIAKERQYSVEPLLEIADQLPIAQEEGISAPQKSPPIEGKPEESPVVQRPVVQARILSLDQIEPLPLDIQMQEPLVPQPTALADPALQVNQVEEAVQRVDEEIQPVDPEEFQIEEQLDQRYVEFIDNQPFQAQVQEGYQIDFDDYFFANVPEYGQIIQEQRRIFEEEKKEDEVLNRELVKVQQIFNPVENYQNKDNVPQPEAQRFIEFIREFVPENQDPRQEVRDINDFLLRAAVNPKQAQPKVAKQVQVVRDSLISKQRMDEMLLMIVAQIKGSQQVKNQFEFVENIAALKRASRSLGGKKRNNKRKRKQNKNGEKISKKKLMDTIKSNAVGLFKR